MAEQDKEGESWLEKFRSEHPDRRDQMTPAQTPAHDATLPGPAPVDAPAPAHWPPTPHRTPASNNFLQTKTDVMQRVPRPKPADAPQRYSSSNPALFVPDADARIQTTVTKLVENHPATIHRTTDEGRPSLYIYGLNVEAMTTLSRLLDEMGIACQIKGVSLRPTSAINNPKLDPKSDANLVAASYPIRRALFIAMLLAVMATILYLMSR